MADHDTVSANSGSDKKYEYRVVWKREGDKRDRTKIYQTEKGATNWAYTVIGYKWHYHEQRFVVEDDPQMVTHYGKIAPCISVKVQRREVNPAWVTVHLPFLRIENQKALAAAAPTYEEFQEAEYKEIQRDIKAEVEASWL